VVTGRTVTAVGANAAQTISACAIASCEARLASRIGLFLNISVRSVIAAMSNHLHLICKAKNHTR
jgi:hypothetical protein